MQRKCCDSHHQWWYHVQHIKPSDIFVVQKNMHKKIKKTLVCTSLWIFAKEKKRMKKNIKRKHNNTRSSLNGSMAFIANTLQTKRLRSRTLEYTEAAAKLHVEYMCITILTTILLFFLMALFFCFRVCSISSTFHEIVKLDRGSEWDLKSKRIECSDCLYLPVCLSLCL